MSSQLTETETKNRETILEPFAGAGGMGLGFSSSFQVAQAIDIKEEAVATYAANHPETSVRRMDVRDLSGVRGDFDGLGGVIGGPPCQGFSCLNHRRIADDPRNGLAYEFMRLVSEIKPRFFVLENVPTTTEKIKADVQRIGRELGYNVDSLHVDSSMFGAAQARKRWIVIGVKGGHRRPMVESAPGTVRQKFSQLTKLWGSPKTGEETLAKFPSVGTRQWVALSGGFKNAIRLEYDAPSPPVVNLKKVYMLHPTENRNISLAEAASLQGFPPEYAWRGTESQIAQMIANSMPAELSRAVAESLVREAA